MPPFLRFCVDTVIRHHPGVGRVRFHTSDRLPDDCVDFFKLPRASEEALKPQHRADLFRAYALQRYGGYWIDCDWLCFRNLDTPPLIPEDTDFAAYRRIDGDRPYENDFLWARPHSYHAARFARRVYHRLTIAGHKVENWADLGAHTLTAMFTANSNGLYTIPAEEVTPFRSLSVNLDCHFAEEWTAPSNARGMMLINSISGKYLGGMTVPQILQSQTVIGAIFRAASKGIK